MSTMLAPLLLTISLFFEHIVSEDPFGTCDDPFIVFKHTVASTDSIRDCEMLYKIFPEIHDEGATKFHQGECAYQCKMELPYSCFKIHAPQTQFDEGLLSIATIEKKVTEKWKYALADNHYSDYDAFFDFNIAFWVQSLDEYITHWQSSSAKLEYFGIEWYLADDINIETDDPSYTNNKFYSILLHSPSSAANFEFLSYTKPSDHLYKGMKWIQDNIPRATFKLQNNPYPWNREDEAKIIPIRITHGTTDINKMYDFYHNLLYADLLYYAKAMDDGTETIFMGLLDTHIEMQFVQRPEDMTYGMFSLKKYEDLLMETHESIITSPYCGQDRWMDNHYAYSTWTIPGLMDAIFNNLNYNNVKYKVGKNVYEHASVHTKYQLDLVGYDGQYTFGLWVIEPGGQSIKIGGIIESDPSVGYYASFGDPQWCLHECSWGLKPGIVNPAHVYVDADDLRAGGSKNNNNGDYGHHHVEVMENFVDVELVMNNVKERNTTYVIYTMIGGLFMVLIFASIYYCCYGVSSRVKNNSYHTLSFDDDDCI